MTRYALVSRNQRIRASNATSWSDLSKGIKEKNLSSNQNISKMRRRSNAEEISGESTSQCSIQQIDTSIDAVKPPLKNIKKVRKERKNNIEEAEGIALDEISFDTNKELSSITPEITQKKAQKKKESTSIPTGANCEMSTKELETELKNLFTFNSLTEVKRYLRNLSKDGKISGNQCGELVRRWRSYERNNNHKSKRENIVDKLLNSFEESDEYFLHDVKRMVNSYVANKKLSRQEASFVIKKWKMREYRRVNRLNEKRDTAACFHCREVGHKFSECPNNNVQTVGTGICFKCGSSEHTSKSCKRKGIRGFPFASCFICNQTGHLSRDCDRNPNGIYPDGGSCNLCGSQKHLKRDCPELKTTKSSEKKAEVLASVSDVMIGGDDDVIVGDGVIKTLNVKSEKKKVVRF